MTSEQISLFPERSDECRAPLGRFELATRRVRQVSDGIRAVVCKGVALEAGGVRTRWKTVPLHGARNIRASRAADTAETIPVVSAHIHPDA